MSNNTNYIYRDLEIKDITIGGGATISGLSGSGTRMVVCNAAGVLSTQSLPTASQDLQSVTTEGNTTTNPIIFKMEVA